MTQRDRTPHADQDRRTTRSAPLSRRDVLARAAIGAAAVAAGAFPSVPRAFAASPALRPARKTLTIGAKGFAENEIGATMHLLLLQQAGIPVCSQGMGNLTSSVATPAASQTS